MYYFVYYKVTQKFSRNFQTNEFCRQIIVDQHPLHFQLDCNEKYDHWRDDGLNGNKCETYQVISWQEISHEEYLEFKDKIG